MKDKLLSISEASSYLDVSIDTLRRWDKKNKLKAIRKEGGSHRYYSRKDLDIAQSGLLKNAFFWADTGVEIPAQFYCETSAIFQGRLSRLQTEIIESGKSEEQASLIVAIAGEIGNNSFDHNLGNWPDQPGVFFGYDLKRNEVILADRGVGIMQTLSRVRPEIQDHQSALRVAFTEIVTGRAPEKRGNGLKFVYSIVTNHSMKLLFQSGDAELRVSNESQELEIFGSPQEISGCLARLTYD